MEKNITLKGLNLKNIAIFKEKFKEHNEIQVIIKYLKKTNVLNIRKNEVFTKIRKLICKV